MTVAGDTRGSRARTLSGAAVLALCWVLLGSGGSATAAHRQVPFGFLGVMADGALADPSISQASLDQEFAQMVRTGVESVRVGVYWSVVQPYPNAAAVPAGQVSRYQLSGGVPTDFSTSDRLYTEAASHGLRVLPVILQAPPWARVDPSKLWSPPADPVAYGRFVGLVARRYGPGGMFWSQHPRLAAMPSRQWQIWNEPSGGSTPNGPSLFWDDPEPFQNRYIAMLRAARPQIKAADPGGQEVLAGLFGKGWLALRSLYQHGARGSFDAVAVNLFTRLPINLAVGLDNTRLAMNSGGDGRLPLLVTEFSWPSAAGRINHQDAYGYEVSQAVQAQRLRTALALLVARRRKLKLQQVFWYTWVSYDALSDSSFDYAGLRHYQPGGRVVPKPAQSAYRAVARKLEGCAKTHQATACG